MGRINCVRLINTALVLIQRFCRWGSLVVVQALQGQALAPVHEFPCVHLAKFLRWILKMSFPNPPILKQGLCYKLIDLELGTACWFTQVSTLSTRDHTELPVDHHTRARMSSEQRQELGRISTQEEGTLLVPWRQRGHVESQKGPESHQSSKLKGGPRPRLCNCSNLSCTGKKLLDPDIRK